MITVPHNFFMPKQTLRISVNTLDMTRVPRLDFVMPAGDRLIAEFITLAVSSETASGRVPFISGGKLLGRRLR